jgi:hypothetical protein
LGSIARGRFSLAGIDGNRSSCVAAFVRLRIGTSGEGGLMLRFYHTSDAVQRLPKATQRLERDMPALRRAEAATQRTIKHPNRHFQWDPRLIAGATDQDDCSSAIPLAVNAYLTFVERMPRVHDFRRFGFMGLVSLGCITAIERMPDWTDACQNRLLTDQHR